MHPDQQLKKRYFRQVIVLTSLLFALQSCKKDSRKHEYPAGTNEHINTWILDSLQRYYYWNESLPGHTNISLTPKDYFSSIRNGADRFSYIILPSDPSTGTASNSSKYGFDYTVITTQENDEVIGIVKLVLNDSPASRAGLNRGDYIRQINGKQLSTTNAVALQQELINGDKVTLGMDGKAIEIIAGFTFEQPSVDKILATGNVKTGYLYIHDFNQGLAASLYSTFSRFKASGITELILDLRYNSGGQVAEAAGICAMIAPAVTYNSPFITYKGNKNGGTRTESIGSAATFDGTVNFNTALQYNLGLKRIYILGTGATASAAEIMINNLRPYMQVVLTGEKTRGKDEASFKIADMRIPKQVNWEMHPIIYKLFNASGTGNYSAGLNPDIQVSELAVLPLLPFGDPGDPLISAAVNHLTGTGTTSVVTSRKSSQAGLKAGIILTDSRLISAEQSFVQTHR